MSSQHRQTLLLASLLIIIVGVFGATLSTLQSTSKSPNPLPTLAQMADTEAESVVDVNSPAQTVDAVSSVVEPAVLLDEIEPLATVNDAVDIPAEPVTDQYILELSDDTSREALADIADELDVEIVETIDELNRVVVVADEASIAELTAEVVVSTEPDYYASALISLPPGDPLYRFQWSLNMIGAPAGWANLPDDIPMIRVAVLDSGICDDHPDLQVTNSTFQWDYIEKDNTPQDEFGHGCSVTGVIASQNNEIGLIGVAPFVEVMPLRVLGADGVGKYSHIAQAIIDATNNGAHIINLSLGGYNNSSTLRSAVNYALANDVYVVAATGNDGQAQPLYPAAFDGVIAVGSVDESGAVSTFSNGGADTLAPGEMIAVPYLNDTYVYQSGTSFAVPHVSGVIALELALGGEPTFDGNIINVDLSDTPPASPTPDMTETPEFITINGRTIPNLGQLDEPEKTDRWSVRLQADVDANAIANELGFRNLGQVGELNNYYVFVRDGSSTSEASALSAVQALSESADVLEFMQEVRRKPVLNAVPSDPLVNYQWHLKNTGQSGGTSGEDLNVEGAWDAGYTGNGTTIAAVDDGLDITHPDFVSKYNASSSYDFNGSDTTSELDSDSNPSHESNDTGHGTSVTGVAGADDDGSACGVGVAYDADVAAIRLVSTGHYIVDSQIADALNYAMQTNDIYNNSWGFPSFPLYPLEPLTAAAISNGINNGRGGKGNIYVWSAGNDAEYSDHANADSFANSRYTIAVGATGHDGERTPYSEVGANLLVNAPSNIVSAIDVNLDEGGIVTSDRQGSAGSNNTSGFSNDCTDSFGGTSASAPMVSGVVALILDANPNLTWRDVQHILVETARKNDSSDSLWKTNAAGYDFNLQYGFGTVDAAAAVALAETWVNVDEEVSVSEYTPFYNSTIPDGLADWSSTSIPEFGGYAAQSIYIPENIKIETITVDPSINHTWHGDIGMFLVSPSGTVSYIYPTRYWDSDSGYVSFEPLSYEFWGEMSSGVWTLYVMDGFAFGTGTANGYTLSIHGTQGPPPEEGWRVGDPEGLRYAVDEFRDNDQADTIILTDRADYTFENAIVTDPQAVTSITEDLVIEGNGATISRSTAGGVEPFRFTTVYSGSTLTINDVTFDNFALTATSGNPPPDGGTIANNGTLIINDSTIQGSSTNTKGGAIQNKSILVIDNSTVQGQAPQGGAIYNVSSVTITNSTLSGTGMGGGMYVNGGVVDITNTEFQSGAGFGGGMYLNGGLTTLNGGRFFQNSGTAGGALYVKNTNNTRLSIDGTTFEENSATNFGGAIYFADAPAEPVYIDNATFVGNYQDNTDLLTTYGGGAIGIFGSNPGSEYIHITNSSFDQNAATNTGGAIFADAVARLTLTNVSFTTNSAGTIGGAILLKAGNITATETIFEGNVGNHAGGAIGLVENASGFLLLDKTLMSGNSSTIGGGGALFLNGAQSVYLINATLTGNTASVDGGAIYFRQLNDLYMSHSTITNNTANMNLDNTRGGGGIFNYYPSESTNYRIYLHNSILYGNTDASSDTVFSPDCHGWIRETGQNIIGDVTGCSPVGTGSYVTTDPLLEPLQYNGGFADTHAITEISPAYDAASNCTQVNSDARTHVPLPDDMRGISRPQGAQCDLGAFELTTGFPADPTALTVSGTSYTEAELTWSDNASDETAYLIERASVGGSDWAEIAQIASDSTSYTNSGLLCDSEFDYRVRAYRFGDNRYSENYTNVATGGPWLCQPDTPTDVTVDTVLYSEDLEINWQDINDDETEFRILRNTTDTGGFSQIDTTGANVTTYTDTDAKDCYTEYFYQIQVYRAIDGQTSELSEIASAQTSCTEVYAPVSLTSVVNETAIDLTWHDNSPDETSFEIQRAVSGSASWATIGNVATDVTAYTDTTTVCGGEYDYQVRAYRAGDTKYSTASNVVNIKQTCPPPPAPSDLTLTALPFTNDIQLDWVDNSSTETDFYIERSTDGVIWAQVATVAENVTTYTDTDAGLACYMPYYYKVQGYRSDDGVSSDFTATVSIWTWCDADTALPVYAPPSSVTVPSADISNVVGFPQPSCVDDIDYAYVWEAPEIAPDYVTYTTFGSTMDTVLSFWKYDGNSYVEVGCNDDAKADGTSSLSVSFPGGSDDYFTIVGGKNGANGSITLNSGVVPTPTWTPEPTETPIPTATELPDLTTVGLYNDGLWYFRDSNQTGNADFTISFGINTSQNWQPLVGDWNGDGIDGFGLYRNGRWVLRDVIESGSSINYQFNFGPIEDGWQPIVGDWDGDGVDGIGLYKDDIWLLKDAPASGNPDYQFRFNPSGQSDVIAIAGDWHDESRDRVGVYHKGRWYLSFDHQTSGRSQTFDFGPADGSWSPIVGDWDEDGDDTIGVFKDGGWRFRNTNSRGNPDLGITFGLQGGIPIAGYRGDGGALALFASVSDAVESIDPTATILPSMTPTLIVIPTDEPVTAVTATPMPTETAMDTATTLPTDTATWTPSPTTTATPTLTPSPTATEVPLEIPENTSGT